MGEAKIFQEDLERFLALAKELKLQGLSDIQTEEIFQAKADNKIYIFQKEINSHGAHIKGKAIIDKYIGPIPRSLVSTFTNTSFIPPDTTIEELTSIIDSMIDNTVGEQRAWKCKVCGREDKIRRGMRRHVETHIEGVSYPCKLCDAVRTSSHAFNAHMAKTHRKLL